MTSDGLAVIGSASYDHFFANHFPALLLVRALTGPRVRIFTVSGFPPSATALMSRFLIHLAGGRPVDLIKTNSAATDVAEVMFPLRPYPAMPTLLARRVLAPYVFQTAGIKDPLADFRPLKLIVLRKNGVTGRNLINQDEVAEWFVARGFTAVDPGLLPVEEQIMLFARATHIAGVAGGAMTNLMFAQNARWVVMFGNPSARTDSFSPNLLAETDGPFHGIWGDPVNPLMRNTDYTVPRALLESLDLPA